MKKRDVIESMCMLPAFIGMIIVWPLMIPMVIYLVFTWGLPREPKVPTWWSEGHINAIMMLPLLTSGWLWFAHRHLHWFF